MSAAIESRDLMKIYPKSTEPAVKGISINIERGSIFGLLGPNGAGKTTFISMLCNIVKPSSGSYNILGLSPTSELNRIKASIGVVPQEIALYESLSAEENLTYLGRMYGLKKQILRSRIHEGLDRFGLSEHRTKRISGYSGGMKRRVNLLAATLHDPQLIFLDEPTVGVDVQSRAVIIEYLRELNALGTTILYTSHLMEEAESICTDIAIIDKGKIISEGKPASLIKNQNSSSLEDLFLKLTGRHLRD